jgi:hypothetical protein
LDRYGFRAGTSYQYVPVEVLARGVALFGQSEKAAVAPLTFTQFRQIFLL